MPQKSQAEAIQLVRDHARAVAATVGVEAAGHETGVSPTPCQGGNGEVAEDGSYYVQGNYQLPLESSHETALTRVRDTLQQQGWIIKEFRMFNAGEGTVSAENPADGVQVSVESSRPPTAVAVLVLTPCYRPAG